MKKLDRDLRLSSIISIACGAMDFFTLLWFMCPLGPLPSNSLYNHNPKNAPPARGGLDVLGNWGGEVIAGVSAFALVALANVGLMASSEVFRLPISSLCDIAPGFDRRNSMRDTKWTDESVRKGVNT